MDSRKGIEHRLAIIDGHLKAVRKMLTEGAPSIEVIRQSRAVQSALKKFDSALLDQYLSAEVAKDLAEGRVDKATKEIAKIFELV